LTLDEMHAQYIAASGESLADQRTKLHEALDQFQGIPFTVQRFAELLCDPQSIYRSSRKLISALDKVLSRRYRHHPTPALERCFLTQVLAVSTTIPQFTRPAANDDATMDS